MIRLHVHDELAAGQSIEPSREQAHYLINVMRLKTGGELLLFNGRDGEWLARAAEVDRRRCRLEALSLNRPQAPVPDVELIVALVKRARLETIVEKAVELGCRRIQLVATRRTNAERTNLDRLQLIATEAAEQTGRLDVPEVVGPCALDALLAAWPQERRLMFCDEAGDDPDAKWGGSRGRAGPALDVLPRAAGEAWSVLIGPEGGFDPGERALLRASTFVTPVTLGPRILRADTAAIAALTLWQATLGDWRLAKA